MQTQRYSVRYLLTCYLLAAQLGALSDNKPQAHSSTFEPSYYDLSQSTSVDPAALRTAIAASSGRA